jgi:hypothetical protein
LSKNPLNNKGVLTAGFSVGVSLDVNGEKSKTNTTSQTSNASNLNAKNIYVNTDETLNTNTNIVGSNLIANDNLNVNTTNLNVKASQDTITSTQDSKSVNGNISFTMYGGGGGTAGLGYGQQNSNSNTLINNNSILQGNNVNINTSNDAIFQGANVKANDTLNLNVGNNLVLESLRDEYSSNSNGFNVNAGIGFGSAGAAANRTPSLDVGKQTSSNAGMTVNNGTTINKQTVLSSITGNEVNVNVGNNTHLKGALLASGNFIEDGSFVDNKNLNFTTNTLSFENLSNSSFSSNQSLGGNFNYNLDSTKIVDQKEKTQQGGISSVGYTASNGINLSATKTLATLGQGNITIKDKENSDDLTKLNTDTQNINKDLYSSSTGTKVDATLDTRLLTEDGRKQIAEDFTKTTFITNALLEVATTDSAGLVGDKASGITGFFENVENKVALFEGTKKFVNDPKNEEARNILLNPNATPEQIKEANQQLHNYVASEMGITPTELEIILDKQYKGFTSSEDGKIRVAANVHNTMGDMANTTINETSDVADLQRDAGVVKNDDYLKNRDEYSKNFGDLGEDLLDNQYSTTTGTSISDLDYNKNGTNINKPNELDKTVINNTQNFNQLDKSQGAHRQLSSSEIKFLQSEEKVRAYLLSKDNNANPSQEDIQGARHELTQTAIALVDNNWAKVLGEINPDAKTFLEANVDSIKNVTYLEKENSFQNESVAMDNINFYKEYIHPAIQKSIGEVLKDEINNKADEYVDVFNKIKEQGAKKTVAIAANTLSNYYGETTLKEKLGDAYGILENIITDTYGSAVKASYNLTTNPQNLAQIYNISTEEATAVQAVLIVAAANEFGINKRKAVEGALDLGVSDSKKLEVGLVDTYKNLKKTTGDGTVDRDHITSKEALIKRAEELVGRPLTPNEKSMIKNESQAITVKKEIHKEASTTGSANKVLSKEDSKDLESAAQRDINERIESAKKLDPENLKKIEEGCAKIGGCTNEQYDKFLKKILSGE